MDGHAPEALRHVLNVPGLWTISYRLTGLRNGSQRSDMETLERQFSMRVSASLRNRTVSRPQSAFAMMPFGFDPVLLDGPSPKGSPSWSRTGIGGLCPPWLD